MSDRVEQPRPLGELLRDTVEDDQVDRVIENVVARRRAGSMPVAGRTLALTAAAAAVVVLVVLAFMQFAAEEQQVRGNEVAVGAIRVKNGGGELEQVRVPETAEAPRRVELDDGSAIEVAPGATLRPEANNGHRVALRLVEGRATFEVEPGGPRIWSVNAGLAFVEVVGTEFTVDLGDDRVEVSVERGTVQVRGEYVEGHLRELNGGEVLVVERPPETPEPTRLAGAGGQTGGDAGPEADGGVAGRSPPMWRQLASGGDFDGAYELLGAAGLQRELAGADSMAELLSLADVARLSGHPRDAVEPLERAIESYAGDRRAAVAAFTLGRVETDQLRRHSRGARAFQRCLELGAPRPMQHDAYARLAEAHARGGNFDGARAAAGEYLRRFPEGRRAETMRRWAEGR